MIRYAITKSALKALIDGRSDSWRTRAAERTDEFIAAGRYEEDSSIWSEIKPVFMSVQFNKCVFCERQFEDESVGTIEHDLEHFRPKSAVKIWKPKDNPDGFGAPLGEASANGYFWLAYELENYAAACKICNSTLKSNCFPIAATRGVSADKGTALRNKEKPYLCYPIGKGDADPETLIDFIGTIARPHGRSGHKRRRAEVMIDFFGLNRRDELHFQRAKELMLLGLVLQKIDAGDASRDWQADADSLIADSMPHAACKRAFLRRWQEARPFAEQLLDAATEVALKRTPPAEI